MQKSHIQTQSIYILELNNNKYYVGKTSENVNYRMKQHCDGIGSSWTKMYHPIKILEIIPNCDSYDEDKYTLKYMDKYGIDNVRGGSFSKINLNKVDIQTINKMLLGANDKCFNCGNIGHYVKKCPKNVSDKKYDNTIKELNLTYNKFINNSDELLEKLKEECENLKPVLETKIECPVHDRNAVIAPGILPISNPARQMEFRTSDVFSKLPVGTIIARNYETRMETYIRDNGIKPHYKDIHTRELNLNCTCSKDAPIFLNNIIEWCSEMVTDHHEFMLWDGHRQEYYNFKNFYLDKKGPHTYNLTPAQLSNPNMCDKLYAENNFAPFFTMILEMRGPTDIIYDNYGYKLIIFSKLKRIQRIKIKKNIDVMMLSSEFNYEEI